jgi:FHA domain
VPIDKQPAYVLGRQPDAVDISLDEPSASRQHAALVHHEDGRLFLIDLGSVSSCCETASTWMITLHVDIGIRLSLCCISLCGSATLS